MMDVQLSGKMLEQVRMVGCFCFMMQRWIAPLTGPVRLTLTELQQPDAGSSFDSAWKDERIPSLAQVAQACRGKIDLLLDLINANLQTLILRVLLK